MHFHLPKPLHGWRAFVGEIAIIVVGVLIALAAEQVVEDWRWHDKVNHAEAAMRLELAEDDGPQAYGRVIIGPCLDASIARIHDGGGKVPTGQLRAAVLAYAPPYATWDSEAWKTVVASDVGSHMGPERLVRWSSPYRIMPGLTELNARERQLTIEVYEDLPSTGDPSAVDLQKLRHDAAQLRLLNVQLYRGSQLMLARTKSLDASVARSTERELLEQAHAIYGPCAAAPDPNAKLTAQRPDVNLRSPPARIGG
jgi:hypothetical protein